eukprot:TRINITY_DN12323_c0_g1_i1.p1 TRINITY_DN12323_c0_g1~~TRINITY_DN12323_c0_g1_i1.p1  ORF type:complete len:212 (-),score=40.95 TRINITY_DN12323_c0_g1_i1:82-717(-)
MKMDSKLNEILDEIPIVIKSMNDKFTYKVIKDGDKRHKRCIRGKKIILFLTENYDLDKPNSIKFTQKMMDEGYMFEIHENSEFFNSEMIYSFNKELKTIFLDSKRFRSNLTDLLDNDLFIIKLLLKLNERIDSKDLINLICNYLESKNLTQNFLRDFITSRFKSQRQDFNYFREDGIDCKILTEIFRIYGKQYLEGLLKPFVKVILHSIKL